MEHHEKFVRSSSSSSRGKGRRRSSSRSPSLSRRPSLKEKATSSILGSSAPLGSPSSGSITKMKKKHGGHGASGTGKKERWLLTRKTWRYMTDAVGNLLPEHHSKPSSSSTAVSSPSSSGTSRRPSSALSSPDHQTGGSSSSVPPALPVFYPYPSPSNPIPSAGVTIGSTPVVPAGHGYGRTTAGGSGFVYDSTGKPTSTTAKPQSVSRSSICGGTGTGYAAPSDDIPTLEEHFDNVCSKEKKFLLWTRTRPKGLSGPALREMKQIKAEEKAKEKEHQQQQQKGSGGILRRKGVPQDLNLGDEHHHHHSHSSATTTISPPPHYRTRTSSSSEVTTPRSPESKDHLLDYYSQGEDETLLDDEYDEYEHDDEQLTVRECRRKSSTASSIVSIVSSGLSFFRPFHHHHSKTHGGSGGTTTSPPPPHGVGGDSGFYILTVSPGVQKYVRNVGLQTEPFPEELLIRLKLQSAKDEEQQLQQQQQQLQKNQLHHFLPEESEPVSSSPGEEFIKLRKVESTSEANEPPPTSTPTKTQPSSAPSETGSLTFTETDKKSEESGYSSSISDTVMRYLRMVRKNSKSDNKDTIDKFKTVNYDRSLRYIKSKNVTVEEALEHEKNKALQAAAAAAAAKEPQVQQELKESVSHQQPSPIKQASSSSISQVENVEPQSDTKISSGSGKKKDKSKVPTSEKIKSPSSSSEVKKPKKGSLKKSEKKSESKVEKIESESIGKGENIEEESFGSFYSESEPGSRRDSKGTNTSECLSPGPGEPITTGGIGDLSSSLQQQQVESSGGIEKGISSPIISSPTPLPSEPPASIGVQAGESLIRYFRYLNPRRKFSDFSSAASYCSSAESPLGLDLTSPRYSIGTTGTGTESFDLNTFQPTHFQFSTSSGDSTGGGPLHPGLDFGETSGTIVQPQHHKYQQQQTQPQPKTYSSSPSTAGVGHYDPHHGFTFSNPPTHYIGHKRDSTTSCVSIGTGSSASEIISSESGSSRRGVGIPGTTPSTTLLKKSSSAQQITTCDSITSVSDSSTYSSSYNPRTTRHHPTYKIPSLSHHESYLGLGGSSRSSTGPTGTSLHHHPNSNMDQTLKTSASSPNTPSISPNVIPKNLSSSATFSTPILKTGSSSGSRGYSDSGILKTSSTKSGTSSSGGGGTSSSNYTQQRSSSSSGGSHFFSSFRSPSNRESRGSSTAGIAESLTSFLTRHSHSQSRGTSGRPTQSVTFQGDLSPPSSLSYGELATSTGGEHKSVTTSTSSSTPSATVMQKSKSSSSVFHHIGGISSEKRGSTSSTTGSVAGVASGAAGAVSAAASGIAGTGSRLISKTNRIFKSRSKSTSRVSGGGITKATCSWTPQGKCKWTSLNGRSVTLEPTNILNLSETETETLQQVALAKLQALNLGVEVKIPKEKATQKPKRRAYLLKKKALSTGFFDSATPSTKRGDDGSGKEPGSSGSGLVFGIPLSQCVTNDKERYQQQQQSQQPSSVAPGPSSTIPNIEWATCKLPSTTTKPGSQNGNKPERKGSTESLDYHWAKCTPPTKSQLGSQLPSEITPSTSEVKEPWNPNAVPTIVRACINHLEKYGLHTTGIFRVSTSLKRIRQLREEIDGGKDVEFGEEHSPHDVAALLKEFLRDLPEPLLSRDLYQPFLRTQKIRNRRLQLEAVQHLIQLLPPPNRDTLALILKFFSKVVENSGDTRCKASGEVLPGNKMEGYSLATLIAPNILPCMPTEGSNSIDANATHTQERRESIDVVNYLITNYKELFEVSPELLDEVYVHMMDTHPEVVEEILRLKTGDDGGLDEFETTSSVFEGSECGEILDLEPLELNPPTVITTTSTPTKKLQKREDILHKDGGKGGQIEMSYSMSKSSSRKRDEGSYRDGDKQSGGESDSSSTKSTSRWFHRRSRADNITGTTNKSRTSSDSGSEKCPGSKASSGRRDSSALKDGKRASSLDSVSLKESSPAAGGSGGSGIVHMITASIPIDHLGYGSPTTIISDRQRSSSDQSLKVPENINRRQSSPVLQSTTIQSMPGTRVITASLKIPVPMSIDDTDIPYIEEENSVSEPGGGVGVTHSLQISSKFPTKQQQQQHQGQQVRVRSTVDSASTTPEPQAHKQQQQDLRHTPISSYTPSPSPSSSPYEVLSPTSPPEASSSSAFPYEKLTARFSVSTTPSSALHQSRGSISSSGSSSTNSGATTVVATLDNIPLNSAGSSGLHVISLPTTPSTSEEEDLPTGKTPTGPLIPSADPKNIGKETKGANIAGLIKSKTADFEKFAKEQQFGSSGSGGSGVGGGSSTSASTKDSGSGSIASNLRLRSQGNIQLKQQFLLRQHERHQHGGQIQLPARSSSSSAVAGGGPSSSTGLSRSSLQRKKPTSTTTHQSGGTDSSAPTPTTSEHLARSASSQSANLPVGNVGPPSRWKRSEIIASRSVTGRGAGPGKGASGTGSGQEKFF